MTAPPTHLRPHPSHVGPLPEDAASVRAGIRDGRWLPQDHASQRVVRLLDPQPGERILELCAGRGVKSSQIAEALGPDGLLVSVDTSPGKLAENQRLVSRWAPDAVALALAADASAPLPLDSGMRFDRVLVDAPCSGLGVIRRRPETLWRRRESDIATLAALQVRILAEAQRWLAPGGALVYAVCTTTPEETRGVLGERTVEEEWRTTPEDDETDGFYAARLRAPQAG